jgi:hypothetical protein
MAGLNGGITKIPRQRLKNPAILKTDLSSVINSSDEAMGIIVSLPDGAFIEETYSPKAD